MRGYIHKLAMMTEHALQLAACRLAGCVVALNAVISVVYCNYKKNNVPLHNAYCTQHTSPPQAHALGPQVGGPAVDERVTELRHPKDVGATRAVMSLPPNDLQAHTRGRCSYMTQQGYVWACSHDMAPTYGLQGVCGAIWRAMCACLTAAQVDLTVSASLGTAVA
jgi:hypothetical protein